MVFSLSKFLYYLKDGKVNFSPFFAARFRLIFLGKEAGNKLKCPSHIRPGHEEGVFP